jgi:hypothetical protein
MIGRKLILTLADIFKVLELIWLKNRAQCWAVVKMVINFAYHRKLEYS